MFYRDRFPTPAHLFKHLVHFLTSKKNMFGNGWSCSCACHDSVWGWWYSSTHS